jgi:hypothetical protein
LARQRLRRSQKTFEIARPAFGVYSAEGAQLLIGKRLSMHLMMQPGIAKIVSSDDDLAVSG